MTRAWFENKDKQFDCQSMVVKLIDLCRNRGADIEPLLRGTGIFYEDLYRRQNYLSFAQIETLLSNAQKQVNSSDLSFLLGRRLFPNQNPDVSELIYNATSLADLLRLCRCYQYLMFPWLFITVRQHQDKTWLIVDNAIAESAQQLFFYEMLYTAVNATCKWHIGHQIPLHFYFRQKRPRNIYQYEENLGHRLTFNYPLNMIAVDNQWLNKKLLNSSALARQHHRLQCSAQLHKTPQRIGLLQYTRQLLTRENINNLEELADALAISQATLKRKLKQHGCSFQQIHDSVKSQTALFDLKVRQLSNEQAASSSRFNNLPNFRRAIKRWTGMTPSQLKSG
ncbi:AraC family transcriptional regulator [Planctobacterium marinum]|uniref:AraC family transcriptional regulator n=1 Tax=Planctobacterium marinum TaxID=1631968 RepID=UPI001E452BA9|nr:AraC family transcriptional regulator [Planctobacterium marinum]MCC2606963.1 AraC family transcriptional regulator [Planctobacterium marinum]